MQPLRIKNYLSESQLFLSRAIVAGFLVSLMLLVLILRLVDLQILQHEHFTTRSQENRVKLQPLPPTRGLIYDRNGTLLAQNLPSYSLEITPEQVSDLETALTELEKIIPIGDADRNRFWRLKNQSRRFDKVPIRVRLNQDEVASFAVHRNRFPGIDIEARLLRDYPLAKQTAHVLGYVGRINEQELQQIDVSNYSGTSHIGKNGVEKSYEERLHGKVGLERVEVNAKGRVLRVLEREPPTPGRDLRLFLDIGLQEEATAALAGYNGAVVAIDPNTGGVLALVSKPGFDPNLFVEGISASDYNNLQRSEDTPLFNRALRGQYPPGSTVKPFFGLAGLETATVTGEQKKFCPGFYQLPNHSHRYRDWKRGGHGFADLRLAIVQSCDVYFYDLARNLGIDRIDEYLSGFGFGQRTGIDLTGELGGVLPSREWKRNTRREAWYPGETLITGIGQGYFLTTPLQLASATATLATRGLYIHPRVVASIQRQYGSNEFEPTLPRTEQLPIVDPSNWDQVISAMTEVVEGARGTARRIRSPHYRIAGKTGTAQVFTVKQDEKYDEDKIDRKMRDHALFVAFAPVKAPRIAVAVIVENGGHGGSVAAPIAKRVMDRYLLGAQAAKAGGVVATGILEGEE
jgi:penicillin-binding protein 2